MSGHSPDYDWNVPPAARLAAAGGPARARHEASSYHNWSKCKFTSVLCLIVILHWLKNKDMIYGVELFTTFRSENQRSCTVVHCYMVNWLTKF